MDWFPLDTWIIIIGMLCAGACALPGCFLVLRKMSMMGDAISHAVLPGLAIGFLISGSRSSITMFLGAAIVGILTAVFTQWISNFGHVDRGASMGIVFTSLFALGLLLIVQAADHVDLNPGCVLYGAIELTPLDTPITILGIPIPRAAIVLSIVFLINTIIIILFFKEFTISSFDSDLATTLGFKSSILNYVLMSMIAVTTVASFEAVGSIIVLAMFIVPPATAYLLTDKLSIMLILSVSIGQLSSVLGHVGALTLPKLLGFDNTTTSGMIAFTAGIIFLLTWMFSPKYGFIIKKITDKKILE